MRFLKKLHKRSVRGAFLRLFLWSPTGDPVAPLGSRDTLRELLDLVARHPGHKKAGREESSGFLQSG